MAHILIIEDEAAIAEMVAYALEQAGHSAAVARTAAEAEARCDERAPDLILTDVLLPDGDGLELLGALRRRLSKRVPALAMSVLIGKDVKRRAKAGGAAFLAKPFSQRELSELLSAALA